METLNILVVEDGQSQREMLRDFLAGEGHVVEEAENGNSAIEQVLGGHFDLLLLDYQMPGMNGIEVLKKVKGINPQIDVIMMTAYGTVETAVEAMKSGALDYITKPIELDELSILINRISERRTLIRENQILREKLWKKGITTDQIIYKNQKMESLINMVGRVASSRATVLLQGESGTGKELFARLIHTTSPRSEKTMIVVSCGALPETLLESELFGHERGAFTGATARRIGRFEEADGGTLFLDEIGELTPSVQVKLLRFLQEREFQRLGGNKTIRSDVRIISATNRDLESKVAEGTFREDLFYRLNVVVMNISPLREKKEDIPLLINHFVGRFSAENGKKIEGLSSEAMDLLLKYDYPGNVRELENIIERAVVIARDSVISVKDLPFKKIPSQYPDSQKIKKGSLKDSIEELEQQLIEQAMEEAAHNQTKAAELLGISERMLRYKLKKYGLKQ
ncbi:MAG: sigma-54-dependent Fis family transcriptional regulator [Deltaproteobacteria bacterium]|nr:sigma-54-dependent Fis family transcriptional regulator [Deltaproteobacteria bacterium]